MRWRFGSRPGGFDRVHIRFCGNGYWRFRSYIGSLWKSPKVTKGLLPHHSVPRLGSACHNEGIAPGARRHRPSMPRCPLRNACVRPLGKGQADPKPKQQQKQQQKQSNSNSNGKIKRSQSAAAPTGKRVRVSSGRPVGRLAFDLDAPPPREAEWRFCVVGNPAWMPG
jgi:hypothetical protein